MTLFSPSVTAYAVAFLALYATQAHSTVLPAGKRLLTDSPGFSVHAHGMGVNYAGSLSAVGAMSTVKVDDYLDVFYTVDITVAGEDFTVSFDTGSEDLWVYNPNSPLQIANQTNLSVTEMYGQGSASGNVAFTEVKIGGYTILSQAFVNADSISNFGYDAHRILGMSFDTGSVHDVIETIWGTDDRRSPISNIFAQNPSAPNFFDVQLGQSSDLDDISDGTFTISEHVNGFEAVANQPKLRRLGTTYWSIVLDSMSVNDGDAFQFSKSSVDGVPNGKIAAVLDTGFTNPPLPSAAVDYIYSSIPGAIQYQGSWIVPCLNATNLTFTLGGKPFHIHPLDLTTLNFAEVSSEDPNSDGSQNATFCTNTFQYLNLDPRSFSGFDAILGDAFLRNVYASFGYGDYNPTNNTGGTPFVQLLSTTNQDAAWAEFTQARTQALKSLPPLVNPGVFGIGAGSGHAQVKTSGAISNDDTSSDSSDMTSLVKRYGVLVLALLARNLLIGILLLSLGLFLCAKGVGGGVRTRVFNPTYAAVSLKDDH